MIANRRTRTPPHVDIIHIGFHRCASTTLQVHLFSKHPRIVWTKQARLAYDNSVGMDKVPFHGSAAEFRDDTITVISSEGLCGVDYQRPGLQPLWQERPGLIHDRWPDAKILIIIRRQLDMIRSYYSLNIIKHATVMKLEMYCREFFHKDYLKYHHIIEKYVSLFGNSYVSVFPFEMIATNPAQFLSRMSDFFGLDFEDYRLPVTNRSSSDHANEAMRRLNYVFRVFGNQRPISRGKKLLRTALGGPISGAGRKFFDSKDEEEFRDYFRESNIQTSNLIGINLVAEFDY